jgi:hypothetical protein
VRHRKGFADACSELQLARPRITRLLSDQVAAHLKPPAPQGFEAARSGTDHAAPCGPRSAALHGFPGFWIALYE